MIVMIVILAAFFGVVAGWSLHYIYHPLPPHAKCKYCEHDHDKQMHDDLIRQFPE